MKAMLKLTMSTFCPAFLGNFVPFDQLLLAFRLFAISIGFFLITSTGISGQVDTASFDVKWDSINNMIDRDIERSVPLLEDFVTDARGVNYRKGLIMGLQDLAWVHVDLLNLELADSIYHVALQEARSDNNIKEIGFTYQRMVAVSKRKGLPYEAIDRYENAIEYYKQALDSVNVCKAYCEFGHQLGAVDQMNRALSIYDKAIDVCSAIGDFKRVSDVLCGVGIVYAKLDLWDKADSAYVASVDRLDEQARRSIYALPVLNNRAILKKNRGLYQEALDIYNDILTFDLRETMKTSILVNRAEVYVLQKKYQLAKADADEALAIIKLENNWLKIANMHNLLAKIKLGYGQPLEALKELDQGLVATGKAASIDKRMDNYKVRIAVYGALGDLDNVLKAQKEYDRLRDELFKKTSATQIAHVEQKYAASLTNTENALLKTELDLSQSKRTRLWLALISLGILGAFGIWGLGYKRRQDKKIFEAEKNLQDQLIKNQELEKEQLQSDLAIKKQELLASALQIQNKNKVLTNLNTQIADIQSNNEGTDQAITKISRQISTDLESDGEWDTFLQSFSEIHVDFINRLNREHTDLSRHQVRLLCLMKMNLSSREIGNILNISGEGVKKARYRVKKKLGLSTDQKIEDFLNDFIVADTVMG